MNILDVPDDILKIMMCCLPLRTVCDMRRVCKHIGNIHCWNDYFYTRFGRKFVTYDDFMRLHGTWLKNIKSEKLLSQYIKFCAQLDDIDPFRYFEIYRRNQYVSMIFTVHCDLLHSRAIYFYPDKTIRLSYSSMHTDWILESKHILSTDPIDEILICIDNGDGQIDTKSIR